MAINLKHSPQGLIEAFEHHLVYEVRMVNDCFTCLQLPVPAFGVVLSNALIESFCVHARNLIDFFEERSETPGQAERDYVGAKHFTKGYSPWVNGGPSNDLRSRLNAQISHLTYDRSANSDQKIGGKERFELMQLINSEFKPFEACLREPYLSRWPFNYKRKEISVGTSASSTNAIHVASLHINNDENVSRGIA